MRICVAGGTDGAGKTTVAVNTATVLHARGVPVQIVDCDVDNPAVHLFMRPSGETTREVFGPSREGGAPRRVGTTVRWTRDGMVVVQGRLAPDGPALEESAPAPASLVIEDVKRLAGADGVVVFDCPGGTSGSAEASVKGCHFGILVVDASPDGAGQLRAAIDMLRSLGVPYGVVINRYDAGTRDPLDFCQKAGIPVLMCMPYSDRLAAAHAGGIPISTTSYEWRRRFNALWDRAVRTASRSPAAR
ncbi:MAG: P-loop NTPase [Ignavibacteriales bacterium]